MKDRYCLSCTDKEEALKFRFERIKLKFMGDVMDEFGTITNVYECPQCQLRYVYGEKNDTN